MLKFKIENNTNCMDARPEVETLLVTRDNRTEAMRRALAWLTEWTETPPLCRWYSGA